jgi:hypothetical protein
MYLQKRTSTLLTTVGCDRLFSKLNALYHNQVDIGFEVSERASPRGTTCHKEG